VVRKLRRVQPWRMPCNHRFRGVLQHRGDGRKQPVCKLAIRRRIARLSGLTPSSRRMQRVRLCI
jgi:hypothetical protein